ncbi:hypothetical protein [Oryzicola mucosus]|uniref:Uncharacterized protein n=1 Tax=Oryzicola mucosus TaxID=2767425 RepID=A0A8J6PXK4_9HYPH|nr:hypothetical protein [Oryzicola mucosus]MBD0417136.1 hypothetical protein [Oryzicola mucosus]
MADSDNTTSLPFVTYGVRRKRRAVDDKGTASAHGSARSTEPVEPAVALLLDWQQAHREATLLCRLQQRLETRVMRRLGSPPSHAGEAADTPCPVSTSPDHQSSLDALDIDPGYARVRAAELQAMEAEERCLEAVAVTLAQSIEGVIAKLRVIVGSSETAGRASEYPWPQVKSVLSDLTRLMDEAAQAQTSAETSPGADTDMATGRRSLV